MGSDKQAGCEQDSYRDTGTIGSVAEYIGIILELEHQIDVDCQPPAINTKPSPPLQRRRSLWFRGQARGIPDLAPTVLRRWFVEQIGRSDQDQVEIDDAAVVAMEMQLNREFRRLGASLLPAAATLVDIYFLAQHHGMPTRLLDWSTNPLAALFFAVTSHPEDDGMVVATAPDWRLTGRADKQFCDLLENAPMDVRNDLVARTVKYLFGESSDSLPPVILPVVPDLYAGRMLQQGSCFTLHVPGSPPIPKRAITRILVPRDCKSQISSQLRSLGVTWSTLFPDLDHLSYEIRSAWGLWPHVSPSASIASG